MQILSGNWSRAFRFYVIDYSSFYPSSLVHQNKRALELLHGWSDFLHNYPEIILDNYVKLPYTTPEMKQKIW